MIKNILMTGSTGFVGRAVLASLHKSGHSISALGRRKPKQVGKFFNCNLDSSSDYSFAMPKVDVILHIAARAHVMDEISSDPLSLYREVNTLATLNLAKQAASFGVKRFVFISSIKVNGESTLEDVPFKFDDMIQPEDPYSISKAEAEVGLKKISAETGMEFVIIRPPLVYGPGVKANFASMMKLSEKNLPLPFGAIHNKRSLIALDNLVDLIIACIDNPKAANKTFLVSDDSDISTTELLQMMTRAAGKEPWLLPIPANWLRLISRLIRRQSLTDRLCGNLQVDIKHTKETLGWIPPVSVEEGIRRCFIAPN
jgi:UDP-glucose 4-epimerase